MCTLRPKTFLEAIKPLIVAQQLIGIPVTRFSDGSIFYTLRRVVYLATSSANYGLMVYLSLGPLESWYASQTTDLGGSIYRFLVAGVISIFIVSMIIGWLRRKALESCILRLAEVDEDLAKLGIKTNYGNIYKKQYLQLAMTCITVIAISIIGLIWIFGNQGSASIPMLFTCHYPVFVMWIVDLFFTDILRFIKRRFVGLNKFLSELKNSNSMAHKLFIVHEKPKLFPSARKHMDSNASAWKANNKWHLMQISRQIHLDLCEISLDFNRAYGPHLLLSAALAFSVITAMLYNIYAAIWKKRSGDADEAIVAYLCWTSLYSCKVIFVSYVCESVSSEALKTGVIIYKMLGPITDGRLREEIEGFSMQMIKIPLKFTALGFFTIDFTLVQGMVSSITTYLIILIQMDNKNG